MKEDADFTRKVAAQIPEIYRCYQCLTCTLGCPVGFAMDLYPHEIVKYVQLGAKDTVLGSSTLWTCASCETCATRCPHEIAIVELMDVLRKMAAEEGTVQLIEKGPILNDVFLDAIRKKGRVHELSLILNLKRRTGELLRLDKEEMRLGLQMFRRGKLKLLPSTIRGIDVIKKVFGQKEERTCE